MCTSKMSEMFWELAESIYESRKNLMSPFHSGSMSARAAMYDANNFEKGAMLSCYIGYVKVTKITIFKPGSRNSLQKYVYSGQK